LAVGYWLFARAEEMEGRQKKGLLIPSAARDLAGELLKAAD
jgi:hypothetical protein